MRVKVGPASFDDIQPLRQAYRREAECQIVRDSILRRGLADPYVARVDEDVAAYAGVWNTHFPNRLMEFHVLPPFRDRWTRLFESILGVCGATHIEAQTNMPAMLLALRTYGKEAETENLLFEDGPRTGLEAAGAVVRRRASRDQGPDGGWVVEVSGAVVGAGDVLCHYNPPFGDIYMAVIPSARRMGIGSYLVQELRRVCRGKGLVPAARCNPGNEASRRTLLRGGMVQCGELVAAAVA